MRILNVWSTLICVALFVEFVNRGSYGWATSVLIAEFFGITYVLWGRNALDSVITLTTRITEFRIK